MKIARVDVCGQPHPALLAESFLDRLLGLHRPGLCPPALIVPGPSVHGLGLRSPIWVIGVDERGDGTGGRMLAPNRLVRFAGACAVIEFPEPPPCAASHRSHVARWHR